jgi:hypothetical protein
MTSPPMGVGGSRGDKTGDANGDGAGGMIVDFGPIDPGPPPLVHADDDDAAVVGLVVGVVAVAVVISGEFGSTNDIEGSCWW